MEREVVLDTGVEADKPARVGIRDIKRLEWQANYFASCLLLPKQQFLESIDRAARLNDVFDRGHGLIYLDTQPCNRLQFEALAIPLMREFGVSKAVVQL